MKQTGSASSGTPATDAEMGVNQGLVESLRQRFLQAPETTPPEWREFFVSQGLTPIRPAVLPLAQLSAAWAEAAGVIVRDPGDSSRVSSVAVEGVSPGAASVARAAAGLHPTPSPTPSPITIPDAGDSKGGILTANGGRPAARPVLHEVMDEEEASRQASALRLIHSFRVRGHRIANVDPLGGSAKHFDEVDPRHWGLTEADLEEEFLAGDLPGGQVQTLRQILATVRTIYCGTVAVELGHIQDSAQRDWIRVRMEANLNQPILTTEERRWILQRLSDAEQFEKFLHTRFIGQKRFSLEGGESLIPLLDTIVEDAPRHGIIELVFGMAHRGRLNVLRNILGKSKASLFSEFEDLPNPDSPFGSGDVKYHKGFTNDRVTRAGVKVHLTLTSNPSHLEAVNPVVEGRTRAKQLKHDDPAGRTIVPVLVHGDAAFAGQGMVAETLNLSQLRGYSTGGTIHIVVDNQIGFTTTPAEARSTLYATDVAKMIQIPIFHVNGDDPEAVVHVVRIAMTYRQEFRSDVVINMVCYRRHGHNEGDEPSFTQPLLYAKIKDHPPVRRLYAERLIRGGVITAAEVEAMDHQAAEELDYALASIKTKRPGPDEPYEPHGPWAGYSRTAPPEDPETAVSGERMLHLADRSSRVPDGFHVHSKLVAMLKKRNEAAGRGDGLDWAFGELMAYAALVEDGFHVRISGQDSSRGTFSHRHAMLVEQDTGEEFAPLANMFERQGRFEVYDSLLSEQAVLGFEYGYSLAEPTTLTVWEAQFGDFANGAQVIIDQFIASAAVKWNRLSGLVMLLPHGYEGQGPEHSSARIERYLQLCAEENLQVANCTTPAQFFHLLRRQMMRVYRAPLIVFTPKSLLRLPAATSRMDEFTSGTFQRILDDPSAEHPEKVERVVLCSGKIYYDLLAARERTALAKSRAGSAPDPRIGHRAADGLAVIRVEQLYPFATEQLAVILGRYSKASEFCWAQEEPENMGPWRFLREQITALLPKAATLQYVGREPSASPAVGAAWLHLQQQRAIVTQALGIEWD